MGDKPNKVIDAFTIINRNFFCAKPFGRRNGLCSLFKFTFAEKRGLTMSKQSAYFRVPDLSGDHGSKDIKKTVDGIHGVISVSVNASTNKVAVDYDSTGTSCDLIKSTIEEAGYTAQLIANQDNAM